MKKHTLPFTFGGNPADLFPLAELRKIANSQVGLGVVKDGEQVGVVVKASVSKNGNITVHYEHSDVVTSDQIII